MLAQVKHIQYAPLYRKKRETKNKLFLNFLERTENRILLKIDMYKE